MENAVLKKFREGRPSLGTFTAIGNPLAVESLRYTGLDYVIVDTEHTPAGIESAAAQIAAAQGAGLTALARANEISRTAVLRLLDVGAQGVVVPCVETVEEVRELVQYAKYTLLEPRILSHPGRAAGDMRPTRPPSRITWRPATGRRCCCPSARLRAVWSTSRRSPPWTVWTASSLGPLICPSPWAAPASSTLRRSTRPFSGSRRPAGATASCP